MTLDIIEAAARALAQRLEAAADMLKTHPCEVYGLEQDCRDAAAIIPRIEAASLERAAKLRRALDIYIDRPSTGTYVFCGRHPLHDHKYPACDCDSGTGCRDVFALVAQGIEQQPSKLLAAGSNPAERATIRAAALEEAAKVADRFTCGLCGMDDSAAREIRALKEQP